ncbi:Serine/threonine-protein kinase TNNI3K [Acropora cervicornis]|uniref:Serine/threonine-protein kinase TNNI3K n=1 Tax=Acropora cervicornis TaxID=6130 RepID=A0AAD9QH91_ACRCE|nr:Serine/threonine-protein kinase TNNI3K [Acropora cervicornis]
MGWRCDCVTRRECQASRSALHKASVNGQYEEVKRHLSGGCAVDVKDQFSLTPLHLACWYGQEAIAKLLLQHGADVNAADRPSLRTLGRRAFTRTDEHSGFNLLQAAVLEGDDDTFTKASVHLENFLEEMNCRRTGEKASIYPGKSAGNILSVRKRKIWRTRREFDECEETLEVSKEFFDKTFENEELVETDETLTKLH